MSALGLLSLLVVGRASDAIGRKFLMLLLVMLLLSAFVYMAITPLAPVPGGGDVEMTPFDGDHTHAHTPLIYSARTRAWCPF